MPGPTLKPPAGAGVPGLMPLPADPHKGEGTLATVTHLVESRRETDFTRSAKIPGATRVPFSPFLKAEEHLDALRDQTTRQSAFIESTPSRIGHLPSLSAMKPERLFVYSGQFFASL